MKRLSLVCAAVIGASACSNCAGKPPADQPPAPASPPPARPHPWFEPRPAPPGQQPPAGPPSDSIRPPPLPGEAITRHRRDLGRCRVFPPDNVWNQDVSRLPVDPRSDHYLRAMNADREFLHPDFGSDPRYGIPWIAVDGRAARVEMKFKYDQESDPGPYPFPADAPVEGGPDADGDRHVIAIDRDRCQLYEGFNCWWNPPAWACESGATFDLRSNRQRPTGWTSADAAGLPVFAGLVRRDEVMSGEIRHALRFTVARTQRAYVHPATHFASDLTDPNLPPLGLRVRLKASYDLSRFQGAPRVILTALKRYGMILADNGSDWFISGEANPHWNDEELAALKKVPASAFEVVRLGPVMKR
jgi:hypothetical protein